VHVLVLFVSLLMLTLELAFGLLTKHAKNNINNNKNNNYYVIIIIVIIIIILSVLETFGLRVPARYIRDFDTFNSCVSSKICPSAIYTSDDNAVCRDAEIVLQHRIL
jgi:Na+/H+ antiporter NhaC